MLIILGIAAAATLSACGANRPQANSTPPHAAPSHKASTASWPPAVPPGTPSTEKFCLLLVAQYRHVGQLATTTKQSQRVQLVNDYVSFAPTVAAAAPDPIAGPARLYLTSIADVLHGFAQAGLDPHNVPTAAGSLLSNPAVIAAGKQIITFSAHNCHYQIQG